MAKNRRKARRRDDVAEVVALIHGVTPRYVNMVRNGDKDNDDVLATVMEYKEGKNILIRTLTELVRLQPNPEKYARKKN